MPIPGTNIKWPWESDPAPPPDTSVAQSIVTQLADGHGGIVGQPAKNIPDDKGKPTQLSRYSFGDGSSVEISPDGTVNDWTPKGSSTRSAGWTDFTQIRNADQSITIYGKDPADGQLKQVPGLPNSAAPESVKTTPSATADLDQVKDAKGNVVALRDPKTGATIDLPKDPAGSVTAVGNTMYVIKPDGSSTPVLGPDGQPLTKPKDKSQFNVPGMGLVEYDPSKSGSDAYNVVIATPKGVQASQLKPEIRNGITFMPVDDGNGGVVWTEAKQADGSPLPTDTTYTIAQNDPRSPNVLLIDAQGNSKLVSKGPDWKPPPSPAAGQALTPDTTSPFIVIIGDNGQPVFTPNQNRQSITEAQQQLIQQLGIKVATGQMSEKEAQDLITSATQAMAAQAQQNQNIQQGATGALSAITQGAQTGAGLLQNRVTAATGMVNNLVGLAANNKNLMSAPAGLGEQLVQGAQGWATDLGGGPDVYQSAANLVRRADPGSRLGGDAANAYGVLGQMLQKYRDMTGQPHPAELIAQQQQQTGFNSPLTNVTPNAAVAAANAPNANNFNPQASTATLNA